MSAAHQWLRSAALQPVFALSGRGASIKDVPDSPVSREKLNPVTMSTPELVHSHVSIDYASSKIWNVKNYAGKLGAIHLWRPHGRGQAHVDTCGREGGGSCPMWTSTQKIKIRLHWRNTVFFSCKEVGVFFYQNFVFGQKKVEIFLRYKLVI